MLEIILDTVEIQLFIVLFLGLVLGSFSTAIIYRTRHDLSWIWNDKHENEGRSFCPSCQHTLGIKDLLPVFSWLLQRGRCRYCQIKIPVEYVVIELSVVLVCFALYLLLGFTIEGVLLIVLSPFVVSQAVLMTKYRVLSKLLILIIVSGVAVLSFLPFL